MRTAGRRTLRSVVPMRRDLRRFTDTGPTVWPVSRRMPLPAEGRDPADAKPIPAIPGGAVSPDRHRCCRLPDRPKVRSPKIAGRFPVEDGSLGGTVAGPLPVLMRTKWDLHCHPFAFRCHRRRRTNPRPHRFVSGPHMTERDLDRPRTDAGAACRPEVVQKPGHRIGSDADLQPGFGHPERPAGIPADGGPVDDGAESGRYGSDLP